MTTKRHISKAQQRAEQSAKDRERNAKDRELLEWLDVMGASLPEMLALDPSTPAPDWPGLDAVAARAEMENCVHLLQQIDRDPSRTAYETAKGAFDVVRHMADIAGKLQRQGVVAWYSDYGRYYEAAETLLKEIAKLENDGKTFLLSGVYPPPAPQPVPTPPKGLLGPTGYSALDPIQHYAPNPKRKLR